MSCDVFANSNEISCKKGSNKIIAEFPDVCLSPPSPPAGPIPVPYPDTSFAKDMKNGSKTVKIKGGEVMLKDQSFYKSSPLGDEAATKGLGANVITHTITGKTYFVAWSMDVKFEGKNVDRHIDLMTSNHMSPPGGTGPTGVSMGAMSPLPIPDPPGDCDQAEYDVLNAEVGASKAECGALKGKHGSGRCEPTDSPEVRAEKSASWKRQALARNHRDGKCFRGGDDGHQEQAAQCWQHVSNCEALGTK